MKVAICVGHSRKILGRIEGGAVSCSGVSEHTFNDEVAGFLHERLKSADIGSTIFDSYSGKGYTAAMRDVANKVKAYNADIALELHFNAANKVAKGYEYLCHYRSEKGEKLANALLSSHSEHFPAAKSRSVKKITADDRGFPFVNLTPCPAVICEPFFGDNAEEWAVYGKNPAALADLYAEAIINYSK